MAAARRDGLPCFLVGGHEDAPELARSLSTGSPPGCRNRTEKMSPRGAGGEGGALAQLRGETSKCGEEAPYA